MILRKFSEHFSIDLNVLLLERVYETGIGQPVLAARRVNLDIPKTAHGSFALFAALEHSYPCVSHRFFGEAIYIFSAPFKSFGMNQKTFAFAGSYFSPFDSWHSV